MTSLYSHYDGIGRQYVDERRGGVWPDTARGEVAGYVNGSLTESRKYKKGVLVFMKKEIRVFSDKLEKEIVVSEENIPVLSEDDITSLVGWVHNGWNNDNGGAGW